MIEGVTISLCSELLRYELSPNKNLLKEMPRNTVLATTTMYKTRPDGTMSPDMALRAELAYKMFQKARDAGYNVVAVDSGSDEGWRSKVRDLGVKLIDENLTKYEGVHSIGRSRRQALDVAGNYGNHKIIVWAEPEKHPFILSNDGESPVAMSSTPVYENQADIIVPRRMDNLASYPFQQQLEELLGNITTMNKMHAYLKPIHGKDAEEISPYLDLWFGPRIIKRDVLGEFLGYKGLIKEDKHDRWESIFIPVWKLMIDNKVVRGVAVPYVHPPEQTELEGSDISYDQKRIEQVNVLIEAQRRFLDSLPR